MMYGLRVESEIRLPVNSSMVVARPDSEQSGEPDVLVTRAAPDAPRPLPTGQVIAREMCPTHGEEVVATRGPEGAWIWNRRAGLAHVSPDCRHVTMYADPDADEQILGLVIAGQVSVFILHQLGFPTLHASAVASPLGAIGFLGPRGQGKSTMAAAFVHRGMPLVTDDVLPLRATATGVTAFPSVPYMKLWPETVLGTFALDEALPQVVSDLDKKLLHIDERYAFASHAVPLRALYIVQRYDPEAMGTQAVTIEPLSSRDAVALLLAQISLGAFLRPHEQAKLLPFYARLVARVPVRRLMFPHGFAYQDAVCESILADAATEAGA
ncbi:MAG: HPr kinase/phosphatase C-terminal domain-containing protein [Chloroflexota bacterium]